MGGFWLLLSSFCLSQTCSVNELTAAACHHSFLCLLQFKLIFPPTSSSVISLKFTGTYFTGGAGAYPNIVSLSNLLGQQCGMCWQITDRYALFSSCNRGGTIRRKMCYTLVNILIPRAERQAFNSWQPGSSFTDNDLITFSG